MIIFITQKSKDPESESDSECDYDSFKCKHEYNSSDCESGEYDPDKDPGEKYTDIVG